MKRLEHVPGPKKRPPTREKLLRLLEAPGNPEYFDEIFPETTIEKIANAHGLEARQPQLKNALRDAVEDYYDGGPYHAHDIPERATEADRLDSLAKQARDISSVFMALSRRESYALLSTLRLTGIEPGKCDSLNGLVEVNSDFASARFSGRLLNGISKFLRSRAHDIRPRKHLDIKNSGRGRPREYGLESFVAVLAQFWTLTAGRPLTLDYHKGAAISDAARFFVDAMRPLDDVPERAIMTAARTIQRELKAHKK